MKISDFIIEAKVLVETRTPSQILLELNVINIPDIDNYLKDIAQNMPTEELEKWFTPRAKKYLINSDEDNAIITHFSNKAEPWMKQRQKEGVVLHSFKPSTNLDVKFIHLTDWLVDLYYVARGEKTPDEQTINRAKRTIKGLNNTSMGQAFAQAENWLSKKNSGKVDGYVSPTDEKGLIEIMPFGEYMWYQLTDDECMDREGNIMGHCTNSDSQPYKALVRAKQIQIYSLRDKNNFPHATIEVNQDGKLEQVKGKGNHPPVAKYQPATIALLNSLNVAPSRDGMRDINNMNFLYNEENNKYGTIKDVGVVIHDEGGVTIYSMGSLEKLSLTMEFIVNNEILIVAGFGVTRGRADYAFKVANAKLMGSVKVDGAKHDGDMYKLAKLVSNVIPKLPTDSYDTQELSSYIHWPGETYPMMLTMFEDEGELMYKNGDSEMRRLESGKINIIKRGRYIESLGETDRIYDVGGRITLKPGSEDSYAIVSDYVNSLKEKDRPVIFGDVSVSGLSSALYQNPETYEAGVSASSVLKVISKSGDIALYKSVNNKAPSEHSSNAWKQSQKVNSAIANARDNVKPDVIGNRYTYIIQYKSKTIIEVAVNEDESEQRFRMRPDYNYKETLLDIDNLDDLVKVMNSSGFNKFFPFTDDGTVKEFENAGLYFLRGKKKFTTDHSISGEQYKHSDKKFSAIKTHNNLKIYANGKEVARFELNTYSSSSRAVINDFIIVDRLAILNNVGKIADVLNHYKIERGDKDYGHGINHTSFSRIAQAGLTYGENGWKGMKTAPKSIITSKINKNAYEIFKFKSDFLIKDTKTSKLLATLKGENVSSTGYTPRYNIHKIKIEDERKVAYDIVIDAINELSDSKDVIIDMRKLSDELSSGVDAGFIDQVLNRGYMGNNGVWGEITNSYPTKEISRGAGGTWVEEKHPHDVDLSISNNRSEANYTDEDERDSNFTNIMKYDSYPGEWHIKTGYTLYKRTKPILRLFMSVHETIQVVYEIEDANPDDLQPTKYSTKILDTKEQILKYGNAIGRLLQTLGYSGGGEYLSDHLIYRAKGKLKDMTDNPKLMGYVKGEINYEDGHKWVKRYTRYGSLDGEVTWDFFDVDSTKPRSLNHLDSLNRSEERLLMKVDLTNDGVKNVQFSKKKSSRDTKMYRAFLNDLMDISDEIFG